MCSVLFQMCSQELKDLVKENLGAFVALQDQLNLMHQQPDLLFRGPPLASVKQGFAGARVGPTLRQCGMEM